MCFLNITFSLLFFVSDYMLDYSVYIIIKQNLKRKYNCLRYYFICCFKIIMQILIILTVCNMILYITTISVFDYIRIYFKILLSLYFTIFFKSLLFNIFYLFNITNGIVYYIRMCSKNILKCTFSILKLFLIIIYFILHVIYNNFWKLKYKIHLLQLLF